MSEAQALLWILLIPSSVFPQNIQRPIGARTGIVRLPPGRWEVNSELRLPMGAHDLTILGNHTTLFASSNFRGRALLSCKDCRHLTIRNLALDGNRSALEKPLPLPPGNVPFARFYPSNGILIEDSAGVSMDHVDLANIVNFAVLVSHSREVWLTRVSVANSGSLNVKGRNNTSGGVLLEEGSEDFSVSNSVFSGIRGNALWTHSYYRSPYNLRGTFAHNDFSDIGRDAIQVGHARQVSVTGNAGRRIGFRLGEVDLEGGGTPVGIDTAGNVGASRYQDNTFEEVNGKCIDLDGFHDGAVEGNTCINRGKPEDYAYGNFGISLNNTSGGMRSRNIRIVGNTLDGMKFGGIFLIGEGHTILQNTMLHLNTAHCNETQRKFACLSIPGEPGFLESGIYLARRAEKIDPARNNTIRGNTISGWNMAKNCILSAPGVSLADNKIEGNHCRDD